MGWRWLAGFIRAQGGFMGMSALERMAANMGLLGSFIALVVAVVVAAFLLALIYRFVIGYFPNIKRALGVVLLTLVVGVVASIAMGLVLPSAAADWAGLGIALLVGAAWVNQQLLANNGMHIGAARALLVQLIFLAVCLMVWMAFVASTAAVAAVG
ncbi:hypothetical protein PY254_04850 [Rhodanobacter sp. AS-Z3]|uniref:hypothetical protein n=1 Tax=Rhodanobacter sp. AS-Z3 TaxID=3031330 RepID=UPI002478E43A|nr:hypothetical protein [Rhodanobacter sp. AS-Z3]WEN16005.1 hypothetical protein PY254_04850 [Rhodanobacter sp. AS-Z3]